MSPHLLMITRAVAELLRMQGAMNLSSAFIRIADAAERGVNVDAYMQTIADKLKTGETIDPVELIGRIEAEEAKLHAEP